LGKRFEGSKEKAKKEKDKDKGRSDLGFEGWW
jgi:hypothetical protein